MPKDGRGGRRGLESNIQDAQDVIKKMGRATLEQKSKEAVERYLGRADERGV